MKRLMVFIALLPLCVACGNVQGSQDDAPQQESCDTVQSVSFADKAREAINVGGQKLSEGAAEVIEKGGEVYEKAKVHAAVAYEVAKDEVGEAVEVVKEKGGEVYEKAKVKSIEVYEKAKEESAEVYQRVRDNFSDDAE
jgi:hypothetical protein